MPSSVGERISKSKTVYPWGSKPPRQHLEDSLALVRRALEATKDPGLVKIQEVVAMAAHDARPLLSALEHLSRSGLQRRGNNGEPITAEQIEHSVKAVRLSIANIAQSTGWTLKDNLQEFSEAIGSTNELAQCVIERGIEANSADDEDDPWTGIPDPRRRDAA